MLVTGADGFVGGHLVAHLEAEGHRVVRGGRTATADGTVACDVGDRATVARAIAEARPDVVINLAGIADPGEAERDPVLAYAVNVIGQLHLIQALLQSAPSARLVVIGSAHMYGAAAPTSTIREDAPLQPHSVYGATKAAADLQALAYHLSHGLNCVRLRLFNLIGPGRQEAYFPGRQVRQLADILEGRAPPVLDTFSLTGTRDFVDVRDAVRAIEHAARLGATGAAYNVASGRATPLRTVAERLIALAGVPVEIRE
ncbi:MAG: NAD-dependent epimerase/dehydratase family protein, partial [Actinobacteria bacterium]|nr:NAD-dependent epimerase/dehydratase family protein [Actinomycetota bacterium]